MKKEVLNLNQHYQLLTTNKEQAASVMGVIFEDHTSKGINDQINDWIDLHPRREEINRFLDLFPELEETYSLPDFLAPVCEIPGWENNPVVREATVLGILMVLIDCTWTLFGKKLKRKDIDPWKLDIASPDYRMIAHIVKEADISLLMDALFRARESVTGERYNKHFLSLIGNTDFSKKNQIDILEKERIKNKRGQIIILSGCMRAFLDSCFFLFKDTIPVEIQQQHPKGLN